MKKLYDFRCSCGHLFEKFTESSQRTVPCNLCDEVATRIVSYGGPVLDPISGDFPSATRRWALNRQEKIKAERRVTQSHGPDA